MTSAEETMAKLDEEKKALAADLEIVNEAKTASEACNQLCDFSETEDEPFSTAFGPTEWHKSAGGGGGCTIL